MKNKSIILIVIAGLFMLAGCEQIQGPALKTTIGTPVLVDPANGTNFTITEAVENDTMTTFSWNPADYGFQAGITYTLQITTTSSFTAANDLATTNKTKVAVLNSKMNSTLLIMGATPAVSTPVNFRVKAVVNSAVAAVYSDTSSINVTPFEKIIIYPKLYVPGDHNGWSATNETTVISSAKSDDKYEGYLYINVASGAMKFLKVPAWEADNTIGDPNASGTSGTLQVGSWGGNNIAYSGGPGVFKINANLIDLTYTWLKTDWGLIGSATPDGWNSDQNMTYDPVTNLWSITVNLVIGDIKFRANDGWTWNLGDTGGDKKLEYGGDNIPVAVAGNYTIKLDLSKAIYKYTIVKN
jgi:hypothetical protein